MGSVKYNVGTFEGLNGTAIIYIGETASGGTSFLTYKATVGGADKWLLMSRSSAQSEQLKSKLVLSSNVDLSKIAEEAPAGLLVDGYVDIDNGAALPKLSTGQGFYSLKGEGIADYKADIGTPVTGREGSGSTVLVTTGNKSLSESMTEAVTWITKNPLILIAILFLASELLGLTNVLGLKKKKTRARARR